ncbi:MAG: hypothetical protein H6867_10740 [Rhodospirillales bacterium]|nr:hypothetical protein [Rhodospirillales bacterium]MCB9995742.1 hypothetical protein [Rhodospirillales bacterium]
MSELSFTPTTASLYADALHQAEITMAPVGSYDVAAPTPVAPSLSFSK